MRLWRLIIASGCALLASPIAGAEDEMTSKLTPEEEAMFMAMDCDQLREERLKIFAANGFDCRSNEPHKGITTRRPNLPENPCDFLGRLKWKLPSGDRTRVNRIHSRELRLKCNKP